MFRIKNYDEYQDSSNIESSINKLDLNNTEEQVLDAQSSKQKLMHDYIACQAATNKCVKIIINTPGRNIFIWWLESNKMFWKEVELI